MFLYTRTRQRSDGFGRGHCTISEALYDFTVEHPLDPPLKAESRPSSSAALDEDLSPERRGRSATTVQRKEILYSHAGWLQQNVLRANKPWTVLTSLGGAHYIGWSTNTWGWVKNVYQNKLVFHTHVNTIYGHYTYVPLNIPRLWNRLNTVLCGHVVTPHKEEAPSFQVKEVIRNHLGMSQVMGVSF